MSKKKPTDEASEVEYGSFKVRMPAKLLVEKIKAHRGITSVADFFEQPDVVSFLNHLLAQEMAEEIARQKAQEKSQK